MSADEAFDVKQIGEHVIGFEPPDICAIRLVGTITLDDARALYEEEFRLVALHGPIFVLADHSRVRSITPEARRLSSQVDDPPIAGVANFGVSFHIRVLATLITRVRALANRMPPGIMILCDTEAEARAWIDKRRRELQQKRA